MNITDMTLIRIRIVFIGFIFLLLSCENQKSSHLVLAQEFNYQPEHFELKIHKEDYYGLKKLSSRGVKFTNELTDSNPYAVAFKEGRVVEMVIADKIRNHLSHLANFEYLETLSFIATDLKSLQDLPKMKKLKTLTISYCKTLDKELIISSNLEGLNLLMVLQTGIRNIKVEKNNSIEHLLLMGNKISEIDKSIFYLKKMKSLDLVSNNITYIDDSIYNLENLERLSLNHNKINKVSLDFKRFSKLEVLRIMKNPLVDSSFIKTLSNDVRLF